MKGAMYEIDSEEGPYVSDRKLPDGNTGHRPPIKGGYFPCRRSTANRICVPRCCR